MILLARRADGLLGPLIGEDMAAIVGGRQAWGMQHRCASHCDRGPEGGQPRMRFRLPAELMASLALSLLET